MKKSIYILPVILFSHSLIAKDDSIPIEYSYLSSSIENKSMEDSDINSIATSISYLLGKNIIIGSGYRYSQLDEGNVKLTSNSFGIGIGYRIPVLSMIDFVPGVHIGYALSDASLYNNGHKFTHDNSDIYYGGSFAINTALTSNIDVKLFYSLNETNDILTQRISFSSSYYITDNIAFNIGVSKSFHEYDFDAESFYGGINYRL